jgi:hypothetical protein
MNKRSAFKVPLQAEPRFHLRRYEQPHTIGGPVEQQKTDGWLAVARSGNSDNDPRSGWPNCSSDGLTADAAATLTSPTPTLEGRGQVQKAGEPNALKLTTPAVDQPRVIKVRPARRASERPLP